MPAFLIFLRQKCSVLPFALSWANMPGFFNFQLKISAWNLCLILPLFCGAGWYSAEGTVFPCPAQRSCGFLNNVCTESSLDNNSLAASIQFPLIKEVQQHKDCRNGCNLMLDTQLQSCNVFVKGAKSIFNVLGVEVAPCKVKISAVHISQRAAQMSWCQHKRVPGINAPLFCTHLYSCPTSDTHKPPFPFWNVICCLAPSPLGCVGLHWSQWELKGWREEI